MFYELKALQNALIFCQQLYKARSHIKLDAAQLKNIQERRLKNLLRHGYDNVSYYRRIFDKTGIRPKDIQTIDDLQKIPITSRKTLQALPVKEKVARGVDINQCGNLRTSGSTGRPLDIFLGSLDQTRRLFYLRMYFENGRRIRDKTLTITALHNFLPMQWFHPWLYRLNILREKYISLHRETEHFINEASRYKPDIIFTYPSIIKELAQQIKERNIKTIRPRMVFVTGEMLSNKDRIFIQSVFRAEVLDCYACNECGLIAWECKEHLGYHIESDNVIVELIKNGESVSSGEEGEVVITALNQYTMPFIRYKLGDIARLADYKCKCGNNFPLLKFIKGRINDYLILPNGKKVSPYVLMIAMDKIREVAHYQIIQEKIGKIEIKVFDNDFLPNIVKDKIREVFKEIIGHNVNIEVKIGKDTQEKGVYKKKVIISKVESSAARLK
jgi:phenylacetate-CoA ligase